MKKVTGECTPGCGACCRIIAFPDPRFTAEGISTRFPKHLLEQGIIPAVQATKQRAFQYLSVRGVRPNGTGFLKVPVRPIPGRPNYWFAEYNGSKYVFFRSICPQLTQEGMCGIHEKEGEYPETCREFPTVLDDLRLFPECTYEITDLPISESELIARVQQLSGQEVVFVKDVGGKEEEEEVCEDNSGLKEQETIILPSLATTTSEKPKRRSSPRKSPISTSSVEPTTQ